jgi:hypothetical protein
MSQTMFFHIVYASLGKVCFLWAIENLTFKSKDCKYLRRPGSVSPGAALDSTLKMFFILVLLHRPATSSL